MPPWSVPNFSPSGFLASHDDLELGYRPYLAMRRDRREIGFRGEARGGFPP
jgi:hypothetical protein